MHILGRSDPGHDFSETKAIKWAADNKNSTEEFKSAEGEGVGRQYQGGKS